MRALLISFLGLTALCSATPLFTVTFTPNTISGNPGDVIPFSGTLLNNTSSTLFINSYSFTFAIAGALDDSPFLINAPTSLAASSPSGAWPTPRRRARRPT